METTQVPEARPEPDVEGAPGKGLTASRVVALVVALGITASILIFRERLAAFAAYGYLGIFIVSLLGNATVILPVPVLLAAFAGGTAFDPWITGLAAGTGSALGELTGYLAGYGGAAAIEDRPLYNKLERWMRRHGPLTIFVLSAIPNPLFDLAGISAGTLRMPVWKFLLFCWLGKTIRTLPIAWLGAQSVQWFAPGL
jgi:membrane protein YqaA with SNARE-associated domain